MSFIFSRSLQLKAHHTWISISVAYEWVHYAAYGKMKSVGGGWVLCKSNCQVKCRHSMNIPILCVELPIIFADIVRFWERLKSNFLALAGMFWIPFHCSLYDPWRNLILNLFLKHPLCNWTTGIVLMESRGQERYFFSSELQCPRWTLIWLPPKHLVCHAKAKTSEKLTVLKRPSNVGDAIGYRDWKGVPVSWFSSSSHNQVQTVWFLSLSLAAEQLLIRGFANSNICKSGGD